MRVGFRSGPSSCSPLFVHALVPLKCKSKESSLRPTELSSECIVLGGDSPACDFHAESMSHAAALSRAMQGWAGWAWRLHDMPVMAMLCCWPCKIA